MDLSWHLMDPAASEIKDLLCAPAGAAGRTRARRRISPAGTTPQYSSTVHTAVPATPRTTSAGRSQGSVGGLVVGHWRADDRPPAWRPGRSLRPRPRSQARSGHAVLVRATRSWNCAVRPDGLQSPSLWCRAAPEIGFPGERPHPRLRAYRSPRQRRDAETQDGAVPAAPLRRAMRTHVTALTMTARERGASWDPDRRRWFGPTANPALLTSRSMWAAATRSPPRPGRSRRRWSPAARHDWRSNLGRRQIRGANLDAGTPAT